jgi:hypothetical protein
MRYWPIDQASSATNPPNVISTCSAGELPPSSPWNRHVGTDRHRLALSVDAIRYSPYRPSKLPAIVTFEISEAISTLKYRRRSTHRHQCRPGSRPRRTRPGTGRRPMASADVARAEALLADQRYRVRVIVAECFCNTHGPDRPQLRRYRRGCGRQTSPPPGPRPPALVERLIRIADRCCREQGRSRPSGIQSGRVRNRWFLPMINHRYFK